MKRFTVVPNTLRDETIWSPACNRPRHVLSMAPIPEEVAIHRSAPSIAANRCSKARTVGLVNLE